MPLDESTVIPTKRNTWYKHTEIYEAFNMGLLTSELNRKQYHEFLLKYILNNIFSFLSMLPSILHVQYLPLFVLNVQILITI